MSALRKNIMLGTAGHVDHGKSALVKLLTGCETDTLAEEKERGLTIDLGFAPCRLSDDRVVGVVDVPGHVDFIRNMVAGAHGIDVVIFVVAADDGIMPQTHEHLHILTLMGLRHGLVALTKIDLVDKARRGEVITGLRPLLAGTFLENSPVCPISTMTGEGFSPFFDSLNEVVRECNSRPCQGAFRVWVEDVFTIRGSGTVITGIPTHGLVRPGDAVQLLPDGQVGRVRRMQVYGEDASEGRAGECVALNVPELDHPLVRRGMVLCEPESLASVAMVEAELHLLASLKAPVKDYLEAHLHVGTAATMAHVALLDATEIAPGESQMVQLRLTNPMALTPGERFVLRAALGSGDQGGVTTIGGGRILGVSNVRLRRQKPWTLAALVARKAAVDDPLRWVDLMLREGRQPVSSEALRRKCHLRSDEWTSMLDQLRASGDVVKTADGSLLHASAVAGTEKRIEDAVETFHRHNPQSAGITREALLKAAEAQIDLFELATASLLQSRQLEWNGAVFARTGWSARLTNRDEQLCQQVEAAFQAARWSSPAAGDLAVSLRSAPAQIEKSIRLLAERGTLVRLDDRILMHRDAIDAARQVALKLFSRSASFTTMDFRDALAVSRKYAVPLLDHFDRTRFTVRSGNNRTPGVEARKLMQ